MQEGNGMTNANGKVADQVADGDEEDPGYGAGLTLPFKPMLLTFLDISYFVEAPGVCDEMILPTARLSFSSILTVTYVTLECS